MAEKKESIREQLFGVKSNLRSLRRLIVFAVAMIALLWVVVRVNRGEKAANQVTAALLQRPIEIKNTVENVKASSVQWYTFNVPYTGTLSVELEVLRGNKLNVYLLPPDEIENFKNSKQFKYIENFDAVKTTTFKRDGRLQAGQYVLALKDTTLGILSASTSDVKMKIRLEP